MVSHHLHLPCPALGLGLVGDTIHTCPVMEQNRTEENGITKAAKGASRSQVPKGAPAPQEHPPSRESGAQGFRGRGAASPSTALGVRLRVHHCQRPLHAPFSPSDKCMSLSSPPPGFLRRGPPTPQASVDNPDAIPEANRRARSGKSGEHHEERDNER